MNISAIKSTNKKAPYLAIAGHLEEQIRSGVLKHGQRLPTTVEFARQFKVTVATMQKSLDNLAGQGFLKRSQRNGTFINASPMSNNIAVVFGYNPLEHPSFYYRQLLKSFGEIGDREGLNISCHFALGGSGFESHSRMLREDARNGRYSFMIPIAGNLELMKWMEGQKDVPWISPPDFDIRSSVHDGFTHLLDRGYRKITFVSLCLPADKAEDIVGLEYQGAWSAFARKGLQMPGDMFNYWGGTPEDGYEQMKKLLADVKKRPEAIYINHDLLTKGALKAVSEMGLGIPEDIALITHANKGDSFEVRIPLTRMEVDPCEVAESIISYAKSMRKDTGTEAKPLKDPDLIRARLVTGKSCGEK